MSNPASARQSLPVESNASIRSVGPRKGEIRFPDEGFMRVGRGKFKDQDDLFSYISQVLPVIVERGGLRGSLKQIGRYRRVDNQNKPVFTFGRPVLDLITDEKGVLVLGGRQLDLREIFPTKVERSHNFDISPYVDDLKRAQVTDALMGRGGYRLLEADDEAVTLSSVDHSKIVIYSGSDYIKFQAWKNSYWVYGEMGTTISTSGPKFRTASITSYYGISTSSTFCRAICYDSDSDSNDDEVEESEYSILASLPDGVLSKCEALWKGASRYGTVWYGCPVQYDLGYSIPQC